MSIRAQSSRLRPGRSGRRSLGEQHGQAHEPPFGGGGIGLRRGRIGAGAGRYQSGLRRRRQLRRALQKRFHRTA
ncbi:hypothetical protein [Lysobacter gummosus]|uniref:hypothetical protein n=1 Tax=Lysobacter gummosus TaxID=262324 RepID=UPI0036409136